MTRQIVVRRIIPNQIQKQFRTLRTQAKIGIIGLFAVLMIGCNSTSLDSLLSGGEFPALDNSFFTLRIVNESGLEATVKATYYLGAREVRTTERILAAEGAAQTDLIVPTQVDTIAVTAEAEKLSVSGDVVAVTLATEEIDTAVAPVFGGVIEWVIPAPSYEDCNENSVPDDEDILSGDSADKNEDGIPDECDDSRNNIARH